MTAQQTDAITDPQAVITALRRERDAALSEKIALAEELAARTAELLERNSEYGERIDHQAATLDVLRAMSASPGDAQPVFDLIVRHATELCNVPSATLFEYDGERVHIRSDHRSETILASSALAAYTQLFPMRPTRGSISCRAILDRQIIHIRDLRLDPELAGFARELGHRSQVSVPLIRDDLAIGVITIGALAPGGFSDSQIELLKTFAEQAVIAISSAETYRALQTSTADLQESLEYQTATSDVLNVISRSGAELEAALDTLVQTAARLCDAQMAFIHRREGGVYRPAAVLGFPLEFTTYLKTHPLVPGRGSIAGRVAMEGHAIHITDVAADPEYALSQSIAMASQRTALGVPLLRENEPIGVIVLARQRVQPFTDKEIALVTTFADHAVIAMENTRLLTELRARTEELARREDELRVTAGIAHEIKNPLNFVNNFAALTVDLLSELKETAAPGFAALTDDQRADIDDVSAMLTSNLEKITEHGKRADGIVKAMLEHSRGSSAERRIVDLNTLIDEALNLAYHGARAQDQSFNITLEREFGGGIAPIEVNPQDMTRVLLNIFSNGFYAATRLARNGGDAGSVPTLKVTTREASEVVEIRVRDNGTGIPAEIRDKLFQPFFTTKPTGEGTGLGLSITYDIVTKQHGGTITVESEVNEFTEFVVTLPRQMFKNEGSRT